MHKSITLLAAGMAALISSASASALEPAAERELLAQQAVAALKANRDDTLLQATLEQHADGLMFASFLDASGQAPDSRAITELKLNTAEVWLHRGADNGFPVYVAYRPVGDEADWTHVPAFDLKGNPVALAVDEAPLESVLVVENRGGLALLDNVQRANQVLRAMGLQYKAPAPSLSQDSFDGSKGDTRASSVLTTRLDRIRLNDDQEPWISGKAEVYAITAGVFDHNNANIQIIGMPYLDHDDTTYYPRQILLNWNDYDYAAANILLYEQDDNTNYQDLVSVLVDAVGQLGSLAGLPELTAIAQITSTIIDALPSSFFTNDDDFVDAYYTIERNVRYTGLRGAGNNANADLVPFLLQAN